MLNVVRSDMAGVAAVEFARLEQLAAYARAHGFASEVELTGPGGLPCVSVVIGWSQCDDMGALVATGERVELVRTFRGLRAVLGY